MFSSNNPFSRTFIINKLIFDNNLKSYLEIGVSNPFVNYLSIVCDKKVSVDPLMECELYSDEAMDLFRQFINFPITSDEFFAKNKESFDIVFVDGDHSHEQSLKDLNNALKIVPVGGFVVLHDALPASLDATKPESLHAAKPENGGVWKPYNGGVWETVMCAIHQSKGKLQIGTFPYDWGVSVVKKLADDVPEIKTENLDFYKHYSLPAMNPVYEFSIFRNKRVSFFTPLYNIGQRQIERVAKTVLNQTNPNWEWVLLDDSTNPDAAARLEKFFARLNDSRVKYYRMNKQSGGFVGKVKKQAASLCTGDFLAELDHDDLLMPDIADKILKHGEGFDFIYSNCASVVVGDDDSLSQGESFHQFGNDFAMGHGSYRTTAAINPLTGWPQEFEECRIGVINPKTLRHIVGIPNHIRVWSRTFYEKIGGHNAELPVGDDYEIILRSFLAGGKFLWLDCLGYLQVEYDTRTTYQKNYDIQVAWNSVLATLDDKIKAEFELRNMDDWAYKFHAEKFGFIPWQGPDGIYQYYSVPNEPGAESANIVI